MSLAHSPLRYPGGKSCIFPFVSSLLVENGLVGCKYIEPYAGGAGLALRLLFEEYASTIVINDLDPLVHAFWLTCTQEPERFIRWIERCPVTVSRWKECKRKVSHESEDTFAMATSFFFLNRTNVSGVLNGGIIGGYDQQGEYRIDARFNKESLIRKIEKIARFTGRIEVSNRDGVDLLTETKGGEQPVFVYLDPPYYKKGANLYLNAFKDADHERLADSLDHVGVKWLLSYDNHPFITRLYRWYEQWTYRLQHSTSNKTGDEVLVFQEDLICNRSLSFLKEPIQLRGV